MTLWGKWAELSEWLDIGMEVIVTNAEVDEYRGEVQYSTTSDSFVTVEPDFLVDVTDVRSWVQCPRMYYLNKLGGIPLNYPVLKGTLVHEVFGDLLRDRNLAESIHDRVEERAIDLGLLGRDPTEVAEEVQKNAAAIQGWLNQGLLTQEDEWRSEQTLISERFGIKGRADAVRRGMPVELKTGKNTRSSPRFQDKVQAACYALVLGEHDESFPDTGTLIYTKNTTLERIEEDGDLSPAKDFAIGNGFLQFVLRQRNQIAATEFRGDVPTGYEANAKCDYCFEQDTCMVVSGRLEQESKAGMVGTPVPDEEQEYFETYYAAIEAERRAVHREYRKLWEQTGQERADDDRALLELEPGSREQISAGRWRLTARKDPTAVSKIRKGNLVLANEGHPTRERAELGRVEQLAGDKIVVTTDEPLDLRRVDIYPSELTIDRLLTALHDAILKASPERKDLLFNRREPQFRAGQTTYIDTNTAQNKAVNLALTAEDLALVHGPPGTGKTYTLATILRKFVERGDRVLLSAFTNRAVDNALEALIDQGFDDIVRIGSESGVRKDMQEYLFEKRGAPVDRAAKLQNAPVVAATTASCGSRMLREQEFDVAVVDEAAQLTEPGTYLAINRAERFVLIGDHEQLPPVVQADNSELHQSLFKRLIEQFPESSVLLDQQYRMAQRIQWFSSQEFYNGELRPATPDVASRSLADLSDVDTAMLPESSQDQVTFVDPEGTQVGNTNPAEAKTVVSTVQSFLNGGVAPEEIGVIAPFRAQVSEISRRIPEVSVDTVDRFQGSAKEVIVLSVTTTGDVESPIFEDHRRMNVALTRAKRALVIVGDETALTSEPFYTRLLQWAQG
jgi:DNA replication ATP-dependent helicase Dna2